MSGTLLDSLYVKTKASVNAMRTGTSLCGEVLVSDGATNERSEPVLNLLSVTAGCVLRPRRAHGRRARGACAQKRFARAQT